MAEGAYSRNKIIVDYQPKTIFRLPKRYQPEANRLWQVKLAEAKRAGFSLYDGNVFSLLKINIDPSNNTLKLSLGQTGYKDYVVTRTRNFKNPDGSIIMADPLAICCAVITSDNKILIGRRQGVDGSLNKFHIIGGFIDRDLDIYDSLACPIRAMQREVREETGIKLNVDDIICLGAVYDNITPHPELCFYAKTNLTFSEFRNLKIEEREVESWESIDDNPEDLAAFMVGHRHELTVVGWADLTFYGKMKYGDRWSENIKSANK